MYRNSIVRKVPSPKQLSPQWVLTSLVNVITYLKSFLFMNIYFIFDRFSKMDSEFSRVVFIRNSLPFIEVSRRDIVFKLKSFTIFPGCDLSVKLHVNYG